MGSVSLLKKPKDIPNADNESIITVCRYTAKCTLHTSSARLPGWRGAAGARVGNRQPGMNISATVLCHPVKLGTGILLNKQL